MNVIKYLKTETRWIPVLGKKPVNNSIWQSRLIVRIVSKTRYMYLIVLCYEIYAKARLI